ncbi:MAG: hypothetical protein OXH81_08925 [Gemmatimonadetes bacterium]|nr:hypothetical protein [Gemmatimonadota bacterium]
MAVEDFEIPIMGLMKPNQQRHKLTQTQPTSPTAATTPGRQSVAYPLGFKGLAEIIDVAKQFD